MLLLDTDIMVDVLRRYAPAIAWLNSLSDKWLCLDTSRWNFSRDVGTRASKNASKEYSAIS